MLSTFIDSCGWSVTIEFVDGPKLETMYDLAKKYPLKQLKMVRKLTSFQLFLQKRNQAGSELRQALIQDINLLKIRCLKKNLIQFVKKQCAQIYQNAGQAEQQLSC